MIQKTVFALGFFDGVHLGHQALLSECKRLAGRLGCIAGVLTFQNHPDGLVFGKDPGLINTISDRDRLLSRYFSMDTIVSIPFDKALMNMPWEDFYNMVITHPGIACCGLVCGEDFVFGKGGKGNAAVLQDACRRDGIPCVVVPQMKLGDTVVSSTHIRKLMEAGDMAEMTRFLGHPHILSGRVIPGKQLGRTLGIPTANIPYPTELMELRHGVYACTVTVEGTKYPAVTNVGSRPTVNGRTTNVESWILDFDRDIYGKEITLQFHTFLRPERKFDSLEALQAEIKRNAEETRRLFAF